MYRSVCSVLLWLLMMTVQHLYGQTPLLPLRTENPPVIDGILDDAVWRDAPWETGFKTWYPDYGLDMVENTKVWYAYDRENLYFAYRCFDSQPDKIKAAVSARDKIKPDDWICLNLDTFNDQQSLYAFYCNPLGIQMDSRAVGNNEDLSVDFVWYSEGRIDEQGYAVEIRIPFKSIRYSQTDPVEMGIIFERHISRLTQSGTYPPLDPQQGPNFHTQMRTLFYYNIQQSRLFEMLPAVTYSTREETDAGELTTTGDEATMSLTSKVGITSDLVLDGTYNPDYSQVEADAGQVDFNRRFALFYPEKRPFFLEGRENFTFGGSSEGDPLGAVVHTRTIVDPILGAKLTGKIGEKNTLATIYAMDELPEDLDWGEYAHVGVLRYKRALTKDSYLGGFYTGRERKAGFNRVGGGDGQIRMNEASVLGLHAFFSQSEDDADSSEYNGHALGLNYLYNTRDWFINLRLHELSENFYTETGYVTRTGITRIRAGVIRMFYPQAGIVQRVDFLLNNQIINDKESNYWENYHGAYITLTMPRSTGIRAGYAYSTEVYLREKFDTGGLSAIFHSQFTKQLFVSLTYAYAKKIRYTMNPFQGKGSTASGSVLFQPSENYESSLTLSYVDLYRDATGEKIFDYTIIRSRNTYQLNKYLFFRAIVEYNSFYEQLTTDFLASFTYIPGTVIHFGYGSLYERIQWQTDHYEHSDGFLETKRGFFFKASYLWRM